MTSTTNQVRWAPLAISTAILLFGTLRLFRDSDGDVQWVALGGTVIATVVVITALLDGARRPWPAVVALAGGVPMALLLLLTGSFRDVLEVNAMAALLLIGSAGTLYTALSILLRSRRDTLARAVARSRPNE